MTQHNSLRKKHLDDDCELAADILFAFDISHPTQHNSTTSTRAGHLETNEEREARQEALQERRLTWRAASSDRSVLYQPFDDPLWKG